MSKSLSIRTFCSRRQVSAVARPGASLRLSCRHPTTPSRALAQLQTGLRTLPDVWFTSLGPLSGPAESTAEQKPPHDERTLKLGKTIRILQSRLPTLLQTPLPPEILSPQITLHLFPSTHPHLPTVSGRVAYHAALWTAPVAWGRVPIVDNVKLNILSERMVKNGSSSLGAASRAEKLVVRWRTQGKTRGKGMGAFYRGIGANERVDKITEFLGGDARDDEEFTGLFVFEFDEEGRIVSHIIEHVEEGGHWDKMRVVTVTDWLLGKFGGDKEKEIPGLAMPCCNEIRAVWSDEREGGREGYAGR